MKKPLVINTCAPKVNIKFMSVASLAVNPSMPIQPAKTFGVIISFIVQDKNKIGTSTNIDVNPEISIPRRICKESSASTDTRRIHRCQWKSVDLLCSPWISDSHMSVQWQSTSTQEVLQLQICIISKCASICLLLFAKAHGCKRSMQLLLKTHSVPQAAVWISRVTFSRIQDLVSH